MKNQKLFQSIGLTEYESKILDSLIYLKTADPKNLSIHSKVPQNKIYEIIKKLEKFGIVESIPSEKNIYKSVNIKTFIEERISEQESKIKEIKNQIKNIEISNNPISILIGQKNIMNKLAERNILVKKEILGVQGNWKIWGKGLIEMKKSTKSGVKVKLIGIINEETKERAQEWKDVGCEVRAYNQKFGKYPLRFTIFDNKEARITLGKPEINNPEDYITIWTTSKPLIAILRNQFLQMWKESNKIIQDSLI